MRKNYFDKIPINKLVEPNMLIHYIGLTFIILGFLFLFGWVQINSAFILAVAISGALFVLGDILQYKIEKSEVKSRKRSNIIAIKTIVLFLSIFSLLALPYISVNIKDELLDKLATVASIVAIGLTILNIGLSHEKVQSDIFDAYQDIIVDIEKKIDDVTQNEVEIPLESDKEKE
ncbi:hypothetical protein [Lysinibacillus parviboronicapiens]|uniref:hypothetical protein n=1 Tax=Lysinibacillus parviboronicapiens TaxID=436516 RepID=UPI000D346A3E|nr:hypothetical protein [Lysinibacillus parviboronicapiens]